MLAAVPLLAERMLASGYPLWWQAKFKYNAFIVMILFLAAVDGAARLQRRRQRAGRHLPLGQVWGKEPGAGLGAGHGVALVVLVAALGYVPSSPFGPLLHPKDDKVNPRMGAADGATARVPSGAEVEAADNIGPQLSGRDTPLLDGRPAGRHGWWRTPRSRISRSAPGSSMLRR